MDFTALLRFLEGCRADVDPVRFYSLAKLNRIGYYFLYRVVECGFDIPPGLLEVYGREYERYLAIGRAFVEVSDVLERCGVDFAVFKSLRPYPSTTVDIDIVIFDGYGRAVKCLNRQGTEYIVNSNKIIVEHHVTPWMHKMGGLWTLIEFVSILPRMIIVHTWNLLGYTVICDRYLIDLLVTVSLRINNPLWWLHSILARHLLALQMKEKQYT